MQDRVAHYGTSQVARSHARNLGVQIGETIFSGPAHALTELVANAHDADATGVSISISNDQIVIEDDGVGMALGEGLENFFALGDSVKRDMKRAGEVTNRGRTPIGNFGWGAIAVRRLASEHLLETWRGTIYSSAHETFAETDLDDDPIEVKTEFYDGHKHGTRIELNGLREDVRGLDIDSLVRTLATQMPTELDDFQMTVNGKQVTPPALSNAIEYVFQVDDPVVGLVKGTIYHASRNLRESAGLYIKVNNRGVGGRNVELLESLKSGLASRTYAVVHANGMDGDIVFTRDGGFIKGEKSSRLHEIIAVQLRLVRQDQEGGMKDKRLEDARTLVGKRLQGIGTKIAHALGETGTYAFNFTDGRAGSFLSIDRAQRKVYVNPRNDAFRMRGISKRDVQSTLALLAERSVACALTVRPTDWARYELLAKELTKEAFPRVSKGKVWYLQDVLPRGEVTNTLDSSLKIVPTRLYTFHEAGQRSGWHRELQKRFASAGKLSITREKVLGSDLQKAMSELADYETLFKVVRDIPIPDGMSRAWPPNTQRSIEGRLARDPASKPDWVIDLNKTGEGDPLYAVHRDDLARFKAYILGGHDEGEFACLTDASQVIDKVVERYHRTFSTRLFGYLASRAALSSTGLSLADESIEIGSPDLSKKLGAYLGIERDADPSLSDVQQVLFLERGDLAYKGVERLREISGSASIDQAHAQTLYSGFLSRFIHTLSDRTTREEFMGAFGYLTMNQAIHAAKELEPNRGNALRNARVRVRGAPSILGMYHPRALGLESS